MPSLPPHGGSGLKSVTYILSDVFSESPSTRREWIEISRSQSNMPRMSVSLHTEGVD